ncbi:hypothetical protein H2203_000005 [Taxawa tesnikishii (nom. ined.)]|nr:hypothetical protein H2203_000005 [Dothideales sp. JES 119]
MATSFMSYFSRKDSGTAEPVDDKAPVRALPASWYTSREMYELERRAIFSRRWLLITHKLRLTQSGDFLRQHQRLPQYLPTPGVSRGYGAKGTARIFACKYHGWSYGLNGKLAKAPNYQELEGFEKEKNGLLPIHVHVDTNGFIWINMDAKPVPEIVWEDAFNDVDIQDRYKEFNFDDYEFDHNWEMEGTITGRF